MERNRERGFDMRSIKLPEPPGSVTGMPEIFDRGISCVVRRAVIIGNGAAGAENQCIGVVRALGLSGNCTIHVCKSLKENHSAFDLLCFLGLWFSCMSSHGN